MVMGCAICLGNGAHANSDDDAYAALQTFAHVTSKTINSAGCLVTASVDFNGFTSKLALFREVWLNKDYSVDFYTQRRKQVFLFVVAKRYAELLTEGLYRGVKPPNCSFSISAAYDDKFGKSKEIVAVTWKFDQRINSKVNWDKIDPREFAGLAIDFQISADAKTWMSDEPSMSGASSSADQVSCQVAMLRANAIFIRATTHCAKNYMDSPAGYYALAVSRQCAGFGEDKVKAVAMRAMEELDAVVKKKGRAAGCRWVDAVEKDVLRSVTN